MDCDGRMADCELLFTTGLLALHFGDGAHPFERSLAMVRLRGSDCAFDGRRETAARAIDVLAPLRMFLQPAALLVKRSRRR